MRHHTPHVRTLAILASLAVMFGGLASVLAFFVAPASAAMVHEFLHTFNGAGEAPEALQSPVSIVVDDSPAVTAGDVYVGDGGGNVVDRFDAAGKYLGRLTGAKAPLGSFAQPSGLAVDLSDGSVYVVDRGHGVVDKFASSAGEEIPVGSFGEGGEVSAASIPSGRVGSPGTGNPFEPASIAVDPGTGDLYVNDLGNREMDVFDSAGVFVRQFVVTREQGNGSIAIDAAGSLFIADEQETTVMVAATGVVDHAYGGGSATIDPHPSSGVAVDPVSGDVYISGGGEVVQYSGAGAVISRWGPEHLSGAYLGVVGVAVGDAPGGGVYVANQSPAGVAVFTRPLVLVPDASTAAASAVTDTTATLHGSVGAAGGPSATCAFQYVDETAFSEHGFEGAPSAACFPAGPFLGTGEEEVSAGVSGLNAETGYRYRLVGSNENGPNAGATMTFETLPAVSVQTLEASGVTATSATLNGTLDPEGQDVSECFFEYGESEEYGQSKPCEEPTAAQIGAGSEPVKVHASITGLTAGNSYHFRLVAANIHGTSHAADQVVGERPLVDGTSVAGVGSQSAELQAQINPGGVTAAYHFEYLSEEQYEQDGRSFASGPVAPVRVPAPDATVVSSRTDVAVVQQIGGLASERTYYYRVVASNSAAPGGVDGPVDTFVTHAASLVAGLPDGRVYELVSPIARSAGGGVSAGVMEATEDGSAVVYTGEGFFGQTKNPEEFGVLYTSVRGPDGWSTRNVSGESREEAFAPLARPPAPSVPALPESVSAPGATVLEGTPDGSEIFFTDEEQLTTGSTAASEEPDLYRYDASSKQITDLTVDPSAGEHADVLGILGVGGPASEEGSYVYLVANGDLTGTETNGQGKQAQAGQPNLYLAHGGMTVFIATLSAQDDRNYTSPGEWQLEPFNILDWQSNPDERTAEVSPDGRYVAFGAREELTGEPAGSYNYFGTEVPNAEVFRYDAGSGSLLCASCAQDGSVSSAAFLPFSYGGPRAHYMLDDGRVFFNDVAPLAPENVNGRVDVYEFEDAGTGTCQARGGCRSLISGGGGTGGAFLGVVSGEGSDVFFTTSQQLIPGDPSGTPALYDARVDGSQPAEPFVCETAGACHEPVSQPPVEQVGGSALFSGPGNLAPGPGIEPTPRPEPRVKALTRAQRLARALKACQRKPKRQRASCRRSAGKRYGPRTNVKRSSGRSKS